MSFNHERQEGSMDVNFTADESVQFGILGKVVGGGLLAVFAACALYLLAGAALAIGKLAIKGLVVLSIAIAVIASILAVAGMVQECFFSNDEAFA